MCVETLDLSIQGRLNMMLFNHLPFELGEMKGKKNGIAG
jgi:hypothetical protein